VLYKLEDRVRPYVHKILVVIEPLLIDEDYYARVEGREIIANLAKAAGLAQMIAAMRPDIDNVDEWVALLIADYGRGGGRGPGRGGCHGLGSKGLCTACACELHTVASRTGIVLSCIAWSVARCQLLAA
jgi:hypothetical protein